MIVVDMDVREFLINRQGSAPVSGKFSVSVSKAKTRCVNGDYPKHKEVIYELDFEAQGFPKFCWYGFCNIIISILWAIGAVIFACIAVIAFIPMCCGCNYAGGVHNPDINQSIVTPHKNMRSIAWLL